MKRLHLMLESHWNTYRLRTVVSPIISVDILGITLLRISLGTSKKFVVVEVLNFCVTVY
jgi:hypothetical protein